MTAISQNDTDGKPRRQRASSGGTKKDLGAEITALQAQLLEKEAVLQAQLLEKEAALQAKDAALRESEANLKARVHDLEDQLRERDELLFSREAELKVLRSEADALIQEMGRDKERILAETEKLESELKEKKLALAKVEEHEWRSIGRRNSLRRRLGKLGKLFGKARDDEEDRKTNDRLPLTSR